MSGSLAPVHLEVHSSSIMSVLQSHPGSFLLLVKNLLEYQDYAPNGSICGSKWNMFNHVHTGSGFMQVQVFFSFGCRVPSVGPHLDSILSTVTRCPVPPGCTG